MSRSHKVLIGLAVLLSLFGCVVTPLVVNAATKPSSASFTVSPASVSLKVSPDVPTQSATITITNQYASDLHLSAELYGIDEGAVRLVPTGKPADAISAAVNLSATDITIPAHGFQTLTVTVNDSAELSDGGHYAALVLSEQSDNSVNSVFRSAASIALFIIKDQNIRTNLQLVHSSIPHTPFTLPTSGTVTFKNLGNTHIVPRGSVSIYEGDALVGKAIINSESQVLFPAKQANFKATFERYGDMLLPHRLRVQTMYRIDGSDVQLMKQSFFWYVPIIDLLGLVVLAAVFYIGLRYRRKLARIVFQSLFRRKRARSRLPMPVAMRPKRVDSSTKSTIGQVVIEAETRQAVEAKPTKPLTAAKPEVTLPVARHITVVSVEEPTVEPKKTTPVRKVTSVAKAKTPQTKAKRPKKVVAKASVKTTKRKSTAPKVSNMPKGGQKSPRKPTS